MCKAFVQITCLLNSSFRDSSAGIFNSIQGLRCEFTKDKCFKKTSSISHALKP